MSEQNRACGRQASRHWPGPGWRRSGVCWSPAGRQNCRRACPARCAACWCCRWLRSWCSGGIIAQTLLERYGTARAGVWKACLVSGVLFGAAHLSNLLGSAPFGVLMQCVFAASLGVMLAAIYFRTGNLWVTVFLHSAMDIAAMLIGGLYGTTSVAESVSGYDASRLLSVAVYLIPTVFLLRKKKLPEVQLYWGGIVKN